MVMSCGYVITGENTFFPHNSYTFFKMFENLSVIADRLFVHFLYCRLAMFACRLTKPVMWQRIKLGLSVKDCEV